MFGDIFKSFKISIKSSKKLKDYIKSPENDIIGSVNDSTNKNQILDLLRDKISEPTILEVLDSNNIDEPIFNEGDNTYFTNYALRTIDLNDNQILGVFSFKFTLNN